ncbi:MAG TPA: dihydrofolate reductase family protein [Flavipsychrobacter sp.]|nr:dihydrofolate reductase family protein [Flavipsychrobacter sp.]
MRKIIVSNLVSLDGFFEDENHQLDWFVVEEEFLEYARNMLNSVDIILFGRRTYEYMADYWPNDTDNDPVITHKMNNLAKIVFSTSLKTVDWNNSILIKDNIEEEMIRLKQQHGKDMVILGSGTIVSAFAQLGLIDEYRIIVNPVILGKGTPLFQNVEERIKLRLLTTERLSSGVIILYYEPDVN